MRVRIVTPQLHCFPLACAYVSVSAIQFSLLAALLFVASGERRLSMYRAKPAASVALLDTQAQTLQETLTVPSHNRSDLTTAQWLSPAHTHTLHPRRMFTMPHQLPNYCVSSASAAVYLMLAVTCSHQLTCPPRHPKHSLTMPLAPHHLSTLCVFLTPSAAIPLHLLLAVTCSTRSCPPLHPQQSLTALQAPHHP
jgi:hypothetical protein